MRSIASLRSLCLVLGPIAAAACGSEMRRFPLREPMWRDTDLDSRNVPCRTEKGTEGPVCRPSEYESSLAWDATDKTAFRPMAKFFAVDPGGEAVNVNSVDEVPDSSWFENRIGRQAMTPEQVQEGACADEAGLDPDNDPDGSWLIDSGKPNGANPGFRVKLRDGRKFLLKSDGLRQPERTTAAAAIAGRLYYAAGWSLPCERVVYVRRSLLQLKPGITSTDNQGVTRPFDEKALDVVIGAASRRGELIRFVASHWLPGRTLGPFTYDGKRGDDPGDVIAHEDRRDLRGARMLAAWTEHFDSREQNSMATWVADDRNRPDSSPGHVRHYYLDLGDCFGSEWADPIWRRIGHAYYFDFGFFFADFFTFGAITRPWDRAQLQGNPFGYYSAKNFDPEGWRGGYPNPAFGRMTELDGAWIARIIARFSDAHVAAAVAAGNLTDPANAQFLVTQLIGRRDAILRRYLSRVSPVTDVSLEGRELCAVDLARRSGVFGARFAYRARVRGGPALAVRVLPEGRVCVTLSDGVGRGPDDHASRYRIVEIHNGQAAGWLHVHLFDLGTDRGLRLAGLERKGGE